MSSAFNRGAPPPVQFQGTYLLSGELREHRQAYAFMEANLDSFQSLPLPRQSNANHAWLITTEEDNQLLAQCKQVAAMGMADPNLPIPERFQTFPKVALDADISNDDFAHGVTVFYSRC